MQRREFIKKGAMTLSALPLFPSTFQNMTYKIGLIGCGWWGMNILREAMAYGNCKIVGLCDVDRSALEKAIGEVKKLKGDSPKPYEDFRELITTENPDIVIVGTPDHWHALPAVFAMQQGAHVYLEKPIAHEIDEGKAILNASRKYERNVQVGTHRRLSKHNQAAMEFLRSGKVGKISQVKTFVNYQQGPGTKVEDSEPPKGLNWDMWVGPAPYRPYNSAIHPNGFREYLDYANGQIANWGIHWFDQVLWWSEEQFPKSVYSTGGTFVREDGSDAPDTQLAMFDFESFTMEWEHKICAQNFNEDHQLGCYFYGTEGTFHLGWRDGWTFYPKNKNHQIQKMQATLHKPDDQNIKESWADFIQSIEQKRLPASDIKTGHLATNMSLLGMISLKLGRSVAWDGEKEQILNDPKASAMLHRKYRGEWEFPKV